MKGVCLELKLGKDLYESQRELQRRFVASAKPICTFDKVLNQPRGATQAEIPTLWLKSIWKSGRNQWKSVERKWKIRGFSSRVDWVTWASYGARDAIDDGCTTSSGRTQGPSRVYTRLRDCHMTFLRATRPIYRVLAVCT